MKQEQIQTIVEDLQYLKDWGGKISDSEARRGSAVLRRLLVEDGYGKAWRAAGFPAEPKVMAVDVKRIIGSAPLTDVRIALAGGVSNRGTRTGGLCVLTNKHPADPADPLPRTAFLESGNFR
jgi:hypothetical protein